MSTAAPPLGPPQSDRTIIEAQLDQLIPPPLAWWKKLSIAGSLIGLALLFAMGVSRGYLYPEPLEGDNRVALKPNYVDYERDAVGLGFYAWNQSGRSVRLTDVEFEAQGFEVIGIEYANSQRPDRPTASNSTTTTSESSASTTWTVDAESNEFFDLPPSEPLPVDISANRTSSRDEVIVWVRPIDCAQVIEPPWGFVTMTLDFGAFPPLSNNFRDGEPAWNGESVSAWDGENSFRASNPLELACEVLR